MLIGVACIGAGMLAGVLAWLAGGALHSSWGFFELSAASRRTVAWGVALGPGAYGVVRIVRGAIGDSDGRGGMRGPLSLLLALRYLRAPKPRSWTLYLIPAGFLFLFALVKVFDHYGRISTNAWLMSWHAEHVRLLGNAAWIIGAASVLVFVFVAAIQRLTLFTTMSSYGMFLGCAALVIVLSVMSGFEADIKHKILGTHAHVVVTKPDEAFTDWPEKMAALQKLPGVVAVTPTLSSEAMLASASNRATAVVNGIDPASIGKVTDLDRDIELGALDSLAHPENIREESPPLEEDDDDLRVDVVKVKKKEKEAPPKRTASEEAERVKKATPGIILGRELAKSLRVYLGDDVSLISPTGGIGPSGMTPKARPFRVAGIFYSGMFEYDNKFVYIALPSAQKLFDQADEVTDLELKVPNPDDTDPLMAKVKTTLGKGYDVDDWRSLNRSLFAALALEKVVMFVFLSFIVLVAAFSIVANGQMIATRKVAEIAILKSMGATDAVISSAFVWLGGVLGGLGVLAGVGGGLFGALALRKWGYGLDPDVFYLTALPVRIEPHEIVVVAVAGIFVTVIATLYPAFSASRMQPVEGLRQGGH